MVDFVPELGFGGGMLGWYYLGYMGLLFSIVGVLVFRVCCVFFFCLFGIFIPC